MKNRNVEKNRIVFSTGEESLSTLGEELRQKFPELAEKMERFQGSHRGTERLVDTVREILPFDWQDPEAFAQAVGHCIRGNYLAALGAFSDLLEREQGAYPVYHLLGYVCGSMGKYKMEVDYYRKAIKVKPDYPQVYLDLGMAYWMMGKHAKAYQALKQVVSLAPDFEISDHWLTFTSDNLGRFQDPDGLGEKEQGEKNRILAQAYFLLGQVFMEYGLNSVARVAFKNAIRVKPDFGEAYYVLGALHIKKLRNPARRKKNLDQAEQLLARQNHLDRAALAHQLNRPREEINEAAKAAEGWFKEGLRLHNLGLYQAAVDAYKMTVAFDRNFLDAYYNMGIAFGSMEDAGLGKIENAVGAFKQTIRLKPDFVHAYIALGAAYLRQREFEEAVQLLETATHIGPDNYQVFYYLGNALRSAGRPGQAVHALERAVELAPDALQAMFTLGMSRLDAGQFEGAAEAFLETLRIRPGFANAHYVLGQLYHLRLEDPERARAHLKKAEKLYLKLKEMDKVYRIRQWVGEMTS